VSVRTDIFTGCISLVFKIHTAFQSNVPTLASCSFVKHGPILIILGKQHTLKNYMHIQLFLSRHFYLLYLLLNNCDGNDAKRNAFSSVALK